MNLRDSIRTAVISTNPYWPFSSLNKLPYYLGIKAFVQLCKEHAEIKSVYLRSGLVERQWVPGLSDIDLTVITDSALVLKTEFSFLRSFWNTFAKLKTLFPMFGEIEILNDKNIGSWTRFGLPGYLARNWKLVYGVETVENNYVPQPARLSTECINYALHFAYWYSRGHFERRFFAQSETSYLLAQDLHRLASKIFRCLDHINLQRLPVGAQEARWDHQEELCAGVIKAMEQEAARINASERYANDSENDPVWVAGFAAECHEAIKSEVIDVSSFAPWRDAIEGVTLDFNDRIYVILRNNLDVSVIADCVSAIGRALGRRGGVISVVSSSVFEYMVRHYEPFEYVHLMRHRKLVFGSDPMPQIPFPAKTAFVNFVLGQVPNVLTYPQSQNFCSVPNPSNVSTGELTSTFQRALFLKLYLEYGFITPASDVVLRECERRYPQEWEALRGFGESGTAQPNQERFEILKRMANEIHHLVQAAGVPLAMHKRV
jgi:hypothetical protein